MMAGAIGPAAPGIPMPHDAARRAVMDGLDRISQLLVNRIQEEFPLTPRPFADLGTPHGIDEQEVIARLQTAKDLNIVRQISAIFDTRTLGYKSSLVAMETRPEDELNAA